MWRWFLRPWKIWTGITVFATCLGIWADWDSIPDMSISVVTVMVWLIPKVAWGGMVFSGGMLISVLGLWIIDRLGGGPDKRRFLALAERVQECQSTLTAHYDGPRRGIFHAARFGTANAQKDAIPMPVVVRG